MSPAGSTRVDWPLRAPRTGEAECAGRVAKLMTRHRAAIDRDRVSPVSCAEGSGVGRPAGRRHSSGTGDRGAAEHNGCCQAFERTPVTGLRNRREATGGYFTGPRAIAAFAQRPRGIRRP